MLEEGEGGALRGRGLDGLGDAAEVVVLAETRRERDVRIGRDVVDVLAQVRGELAADEEARDGAVKGVVAADDVRVQLERDVQLEAVEQHRGALEPLREEAEEVVLVPHGRDRERLEAPRREELRVRALLGAQPVALAVALADAELRVLRGGALRPRAEQVQVHAERVAREHVRHHKCCGGLLLRHSLHRLLRTRTQTLARDDDVFCFLFF